MFHVRFFPYAEPCVLPWTGRRGRGQIARRRNRRLHSCSDDDDDDSYVVVNELLHLMQSSLMSFKNVGVILHPADRFSDLISGLRKSSQGKERQRSTRTQNYICTGYDYGKSYRGRVRQRIGQLLRKTMTSLVTFWIVKPVPVIYSRRIYSTLDTKSWRICDIANQ